MIVYGASLSPFVFKVLVAAREKSLEVELRETVPRDQDSEFRAASPFGKIPGFRDGDFVLSDSTAIITYLEAIQPEPALIPQDPRNRATAIWFEEMADTVFAEVTLKIFFNRWVAFVLGEPADESIALNAEQNLLPPIFDYLERITPEEGFLLGDRLSVADIAVVAQLVTLDHLGLLPDKQHWPRLAAYYNRMLKRPSISELVEPDRARFAEMKPPAEATVNA